MDRKKLLSKLEKIENFNRKDILDVAIEIDETFSVNSINWLVKVLLDDNLICRIGRNKYIIKYQGNRKRKYDYEPSEKLQKVIDCIKEEYPLVEFQAWESIQLNVVLNHQLAHNRIFIEVENMLEGAVFNTLREKFGNVLLKPSVEMFTQYADDDGIAILKMITQTPGDKKHTHKILIEKLIVDIATNKLLRAIYATSECEQMIEDIFSIYIVDETKLFRYAARRNASDKIRKIIMEKTNIKLHDSKS